MQAKLERGKAAFRMHGVGLSVAILASATLSLTAPDRALAACGTGSHPAGVHAAASGGGGTHAATSTVATSGGGGGGSGTLGCAGGSSGSAMRGLPVAASGRVLEPGAHAARTETHARNAATRTPGATAHLRSVGHRA
jgi:hypothetical protein